MTGDFDRALASAVEGLSLAEETGEHWTKPLLLRRKGDIHLRRDLTNSGPAEEAFVSAIGVAKQQGARSYEMLASLSLAKLYQSTARVAEARAVLEPALEGFRPIAEMPEIAKAQALLDRIA